VLRQKEVSFKKKVKDQGAKYAHNRRRKKRKLLESWGHFETGNELKTKGIQGQVRGCSPDPDQGKLSSLKTKGEGKSGKSIRRAVDGKGDGSSHHQEQTRGKLFRQNKGDVKGC